MNFVIYWNASGEAGEACFIGMIPGKVETFVVGGAGLFHGQGSGGAMVCRSSLQPFTGWSG